MMNSKKVAKKNHNKSNTADRFAPADFFVEPVGKVKKHLKYFYKTANYCRDNHVI